MRGAIVSATAGVARGTTAKINKSPDLPSFNLKQTPCDAGTVSGLTIVTKLNCLKHVRLAATHMVAKITLADVAVSHEASLRPRFVKPNSAEYESSAKRDPKTQYPKNHYLNWYSGQAVV